MTFWDTSALMPLLVNEAASAKRARQLQADAALAVWWGTPVECESALARRVREGSLPTGLVQAARSRLATLTEHWHEVPPSPAVRRLAVRLLRTHALRAVDALQLAAALSLVQAGATAMPFFTADTRLAAAAEIEGLALR